MANQFSVKIFSYTYYLPALLFFLKQISYFIKHVCLFVVIFSDGCPFSRGVCVCARVGVWVCEHGRIVCLGLNSVQFHLECGISEKVTNARLTNQTELLQTTSFIETTLKKKKIIDGCLIISLEILWLLFNSRF